MGVQVGFISDFGFHEKYGNYYFLGSGCLLTFTDLMNHKEIKMNEEWEKKFFLCDGRNSERVCAAVDALVERQSASKEMLPLRRYYKAEIRTDFDVDSPPIRKDRSGSNKLMMKSIVAASRIMSKFSSSLYSSLK
jgi:hypothetical protein